MLLESHFSSVASLAFPARCEDNFMNRSRDFEGAEKLTPPWKEHKFRFLWRKNIWQWGSAFEGTLSVFTQKANISLERERVEREGVEGWKGLRSVAPIHPQFGWKFHCYLQIKLFCLRSHEKCFHIRKRERENLCSFLMRADADTQFRFIYACGHSALKRQTKEVFPIVCARRYRTATFLLAC